MWALSACAMWCLIISHFHPFSSTWPWKWTTLCGRSLFIKSFVHKSSHQNTFALFFLGGNRRYFIIKSSLNFGPLSQWDTFGNCHQVSLNQFWFRTIPDYLSSLAGQECSMIRSVNRVCSRKWFMQKKNLEGKAKLSQVFNAARILLQSIKLHLVL